MGFAEEQGDRDEAGQEQRGEHECHPAGVRTPVSGTCFRPEGMRFSRHAFVRICGGLGLGFEVDQQAYFPEDLWAEFGDRRWVPIDPPKFLIMRVTNWF
jgi:hypothetical protein